MKKKHVAIIVIGVLILIGALLWISTGSKKESVEKEPENREEQQKEEEKQEESEEEGSDIRSWFESDHINEKKDGKFPYAIPKTGLVIRAVKSYTGVFIEDGSDREISKVSTIIVDNKGNQYVEYAQIMLPCDGKDLVYEVRTLAPGATMVVQEKNATPYSDGKYGDCKVEIAYMDKMEMSEDQIQVSETEKGSLRIQNMSEKDIASVRVFYKFYIKDLDVSVGGITYTSKVQALKAGEVREITPSHYDAGASKVMMVRTYDTN